MSTWLFPSRKGGGRGWTCYRMGVFRGRERGIVAIRRGTGEEGSAALAID